MKLQLPQGGYETTMGANESLKGVDEWMRQLREIGNSAAEFIQQLSAVETQAINSFRPIFLAAVESVQRLPEDLRTVISALAGRGWYISSEMDMGFIRELQAEIESCNLAEVDKMMESWIASNAKDIETRAVDRFSNRAHIISSALRAHRDGYFELSVPVLLIQVEGMCLQEFNTKFYSTRKGIPQTKELVESISTGPITDAFLSPLCQPSGLTASEGYRSCFPNSLNRHEILHGTSTDYCTFANSLKAMSLMEFFVSIVVQEQRIPKH
ncbi:hypothetical protein [Geomesophilobacter sediminis]|uniref:Uncharacterized protein n=1 Tax=Geomesophilobacter sediminis TaxID=2798584 RepID=A0A8J7M2L9_9BACT|nr:hypothetical protein [Geomesophilobacter sediminis]MBJ6727173.1 hypothetical protein [Geomesophilobacter sediminis]